MPRIFISYRRSDSSQVTARIYDRLRDEFGQQNVFKDVDNIPPGSDFRVVLREAISQCRVMLVVIGPTWTNATHKSGARRLDDPNDSVRIEVETGLHRKEIRVIPLLVEGASIPSVDDLPASLHELSYINALTIHNDPLFHRNVDSLIRVLHEALHPKRKRITYAGIATGIIALIIGFFLILSLLSNGDSPSSPTATGTVEQVVQANTPSAPEPPTQTLSPTETFTPSITPTPTVTLDIALIVGTLDANAILAQATQNALATVAARATEYAIAIQAVIDATATATLWTATFTPNITASIETFRTQQAATNTQAWIDSWTDTPTPTYTATITQTFTQTRTPTATLTHAPTNTPIPLGYPGNPVTSNDQWTEIVTQDFDGVTMVLVPAGCFYMGDTGEGGRQCFDEPFWIDQTEVTNGQYGSSGYFSGADLPRESVTWFEARDFCESRDARLPTEAEWEYAARGPSEWVYPWGNEWNPESAVSLENSGQTANVVGSIPAGASWVGALDMSGNVWEWVSSLYQRYPVVEGDGRESDTGDFTDDRRALRGGAWISGGGADVLRAGYRLALNPNFFGYSYGFRCARSF